MLIVFHYRSNATLHNIYFIGIVPVWSDWDQWGACSVSCDDGWRIRARHCVNRLTQETLGSWLCGVDDYQVEHCFINPCPGAG